MNDSIGLYVERATSVNFEDQLRDDLPIALAMSDETLPWLICIGGLNQRMGMPVHEFVNAAQGVPANKMFIRDSTRLWYQKGLPGLADNFESAGLVIGQILDRLHANRRMAAASSAGGFAAMGWGKSLKLDYSVLFSPQSTIRLADKINKDTRWLKFVWKSWIVKKPTLDVAQKDLYSPDRKIRVIYPSDVPADRFQAQRLHGFPGVTLDERQSDDHSIVRELRDSGELSSLLSNGLEALTNQPN